MNKPMRCKCGRYISEGKPCSCAAWWLRAAFAVAGWPRVRARRRRIDRRALQLWEGSAGTGKEAR